MRMQFDKDDIKSMFGPLAASPNVRVYAINEKGEEVEFKWMIVEARMPRKISKGEKEVIDAMFG